MSLATNVMSHIRAWSERSVLAAAALARIDALRFPETRGVQRALRSANDLVQFVNTDAYLHSIGAEILISENATWIRTGRAWFVLNKHTWPLLLRPFEREAFAEMSSHVPRPGLVYDVGANFGLHSVGFAQLGADVSVHAFEPVPLFVRLLRQNLEKNECHGVVVNALAVSERRGMVKITTGFGTGNYVVSSHSSVVEPRAIAVGSVSLDEYWAETGRPRVHLIKVDVEGAEELVLRGASELLRTVQPVIFIELAEAWLARFNTTRAACLERLVAAGYSRVKVVSGGPEMSWLPISKFSFSDASNHVFAV